MSLKERRAVVVSSLRKRTRYSRNFSVERHIPSPSIAALAVTVRKNHDSAHFSSPTRSHPQLHMLSQFSPAVEHSYSRVFFNAPLFLRTAGTFCKRFANSVVTAVRCAAPHPLLKWFPCLWASCRVLLVPSAPHLYNAPDAQKRQFH